MDKLLSIIVPMFNCQEFIKECLLSIVSEMEPHDELLIIDDGSSDRSAELADEAIRGCRDAVLSRKANGGVSSARNVGLEAATGCFVVFVDADDVLVPGWRSGVHRALEKNANADLIFLSKEDIDDERANIDDVVDAIIGVESRITLQAGGSVWSKLYKLASIKSGGIKFDKNINHGEDALFNIEILLKSSTWAFEQEAIYRYRMSDSSATHSFSERFLLSNISYINRLRKVLSESGKFDTGHIDLCIRTSLVYSIFIYAKKLAAAGDLATLLEGAHSLYRDDNYQCFFAMFEPTSSASKLVAFNYRAVKAGMLVPLALAYRLLSRFKSTKEKWVEI
jgi:glycosyltransferase involved in cell wall biosynthesis